MPNHKCIVLGLSFWHSIVAEILCECIYLKWSFKIFHFFALFFFFDSVNVVQWSEDLYEKQLIERTIDACGGVVDIVIDFGTTSRSLHRSMQCLGKGGVVLVSEEVGEKLLPKFSSLAEKREQKLRAVANGTIEQLTELVRLVASHEVSIKNQFSYYCSTSFIIMGFRRSKSINDRSLLIIPPCFDNQYYETNCSLFWFFFLQFRLSRHHTPSFHATKHKKLSASYANQRSRAGLYSSSTTLSKLCFVFTEIAKTTA